MPTDNEAIVKAWAEATANDDAACEDLRCAARRYLADREDPRWEFRRQLPEFLISTIEALFCHQQGEDLSGRAIRGKPFLLQPWQKFCCYNIGGFYYPATDIRRYTEAFLMLCRKNGKTPFATALLWALALWYSCPTTFTGSASPSTRIRDTASAFWIALLDTASRGRSGKGT